MTQKELILQYLSDFGSITPMQAFADLGITKLATRISEMKSEDNLSFHTEWVEGKNRYGKTMRYCRYRLAE